MTQLYIDNQLADVDPAIDLAISATAPSSLGGTEEVVCSNELSIPATPHNRRLMGCCSHPHSQTMFNQQEHTARVEVDGCVILEGRAHLVATEVGAEGCYRLKIVGERAAWRRTLEESLATLVGDWSEGVTPATLRVGWTKPESLVRFLPVARGSAGGMANYRGRILPENYHPFIHLGSLLGAMFAKAGYAIRSNFLDSDLFRSLYMSGRWRELGAEGWKSAMDFKAVRSTDSDPTKAHYFGRVFASPLKNFHSVGNLVDLPDGSVDGAFNAGCFGVEESTGRICFTPTHPVTVAFDYHLRWRTDYRIKSRTELLGLGSVQLNLTDGESIPIANTFHDFRHEGLDADYGYNLIIFEEVEGATYHLVAEEVLADGSEQTLTLLTTPQRFTPFIKSTANPLRNLRVELEVEDQRLSLITDWAIYDGCVTERGTTELEVSLRSSAVGCSPDNPAYFDNFYFYGGEEDMEVTVLAGCSIQPVFYPHPPLVGTLSWGDVAALPITGMDVLVALQRLFDLCVQTDPIRKVVYIEPRRDFYDGEVVDFTERVDVSEPIVVEELGDDQWRHFRLAYRAGDGAVEEWEREMGESFGEWSAPIHNLFAKEGTRSVENNLFVASLCEQGEVALAPSASLIATKSSGASAKRQCVQNLNFPTKILSFRGMQPLPEGEVWGFPQGSAGEYPLLTFFDDGSLGGTPRSLLFDDRDGAEGLHKWWDGSIDTLNFSRRLLARVHLRPEEMESLVGRGGVGCDFRSLYMLRVEGERVLCRLERVGDYNPNEPSVEMVFVTV